MGNKVYWKGHEELAQSPEFVEKAQNEFPAEMSVDEFLGDEKLKETNTGRRDFLKFLGFSVGAATLAACETPVIKSIPYVNKPEEITPGVATWYASSYYDGNDYASVLVKTREGRPIHIKGNALSPVTMGSVNARINSSVLSLYDSTRLNGPIKNGAAEPMVSWTTIDNEVGQALADVSAKGGTIAVLSNTIISPSTQGAMAEFAAKYSSNGYDMMGGATETAAADSVVADAVDVPVDGADAMAMPASSGGATFRHVQYDPVSYSAMRKANEKSFGKAVIPGYNFEKADVIVSIGADFMSNWLMSTQYIKGYAANRKPDGKMSRHFQFESIMSITGANADVRRAIKPSQYGKVAAALANKLGGSVSVDTSDLDDNVVAAIDMAANELSAAKGKCLVVAGGNNLGTQMVVNSINSKLGNIGSTVDLDNHSLMKQGDDEAVQQLVADMNAGKIDALLVYGVNPSWTLPNAAEFNAGLEKVGLTVSFSTHNDETASLCQYVCPDNHFLESWNDLSPVVGHFAVQQPSISKLYDTRQAQDTLLAWAGSNDSYYDFMKALWGKYNMSGDAWNKAVHDGFATDAPKAARGYADNGSMSEAAASIGAVQTGDYEVILYTKAGVGEGQQSGNPWLHELPDPITKVTWDNYLTMSPADIREMDITNASTGIFRDAVYTIGQEWKARKGRVVVNGVTMELPIYPQPGQKRGTIGIALGYGRSAGPDAVGKAAYQYGRYGDPELDENGEHLPVGKNAYPMVSVADGMMDYSGGATFEPLEDEYYLACTQTHHTLMGRTSVVRETTLDVYKNGDRNDYNPKHALTVHEDGQTVKKPVHEIDLWDAHPVEKIGHRWGMSIDLSTCVGCGVCITACNSENNVPVVGKDEVRRVREMHWLRLDRYYSSDEDAAYFEAKEDPNTNFSYEKMEIPAEENPQVVFMPMMCQHCNHAPCETVCPVAATTHSNEGLNQMTYNRCIGTRYCANNCPYKVRRFNWFNYNAYKKFTAVNPAQDDMGRMVLNPDVTVRTRGVMEKCSLCVQQIQAGKLAAKKEGRGVRDGEIQTACSSSCPTDAITFGDLNDDQTEIAQNAADDRAYLALEEVGVQPNIYYMTKVRNSNVGEV